MSVQPGSGYTFTSSSLGTNLSVETRWAPWQLTGYFSDDGHPFKIINVSINAGGNVIYQVQSGIINNIVPLLDDYISSTTVLLDRVTAGVANPPTAELTSVNYDATTKTSYIVLRSGPDATTGDFPSSDVTSARYPVVIGGNDPTPTDTDTQAFVIIGTITVDNVTTPTTFTVSQNVTGSLWGDRLKTGTATARYYYARI
jgi:hypothetical protein